MTEAEFKKAMKDIVITVLTGGVLLYLFIILAFIYDIH
jgi:hypothetical protein